MDLRASTVELLLNILICCLHIQSNSHKKKSKNRANTVVMVTEAFKSNAVQVALNFSHNPECHDLSFFICQE